MAFLDELLKGGSNYTLELTQGGASIKPLSNSDDDVDAFEGIVEQIEQNDGDGYTVHMKHQTGERGYGLVDLVLIAIE